MVNLNENGLVDGAVVTTKPVIDIGVFGCLSLVAAALVNII